MPLMHGKSKASFGHNVGAEMKAGKPQSQALAIAYNIKRHAMKKKMAQGGDVDNETLGEKIHYPKGPSYMAKGGHMHDSMCMAPGGMCYAMGGHVAKLGSGKRFEKLEHSLAHEKGIHDPGALAAHIGREKYGNKKMNAMARHKKMAEGGMIDRDDESRGYDESVMKKDYGPSHNEDLDPMDEPEHMAEKEMMRQNRFGYKAQNYEDLPHPMEPKESVHVDDENLPEHMDPEDVPSHMFSKGGIARGIMAKHKMKMMAMGGSVWDEAENDESGIYGGDRFEADREHEEELDAYAMGGRIEEGESADNQYPDEHPDNDYLSDEEQTPYFHYNDMDALEPSMKRKNMISKIMRGLHERNR